MSNTFSQVRIGNTNYLYVVEDWEREIFITEEVIRLGHPAWVRLRGDKLHITCANGEAIYSLCDPTENGVKAYLRRGRLVESVFEPAAEIRAKRYDEEDGV